MAERLQDSNHSSVSSWFGTVPRPVQGLCKLTVEISTLIGCVCVCVCLSVCQTVEEKEEEKRRKGQFHREGNHPGWPQAWQKEEETWPEGITTGWTQRYS